MNRRPALLALSACLLVHGTAMGGDTVRPEDRAGRTGSKPVVTSGAFGNALRLAKMLGDDRTVAHLLAAQVSSGGATEAEVAEAVAALENLGEPEEAAKLLRQRLQVHPREQGTKVLLAELLGRDGDSAAAAAVWDQLDDPKDPFALSTSQIVEYGRDLGRIGRTEDAFALLKGHKYGVTDDEIDFWHDLATLAWELEDDDTALMAYRKTWDKDPRLVNVASRLMTLAKEHGQVDLAIKVALSDYSWTHEPTTVLFAADLEAERSNWVAARKIIDLADADPAAFAKRVEYWLMRGEVYSRLGHAKTAEAAYRTVLTLRPTSTEAQAAVLSYDIDGTDDEKLSRDLDRWRATAALTVDLWKPYALGLDRLGRIKEAIEFYARDLKAHPDDDSVGLELADALERAGNAAIADRLRRHFMSKHQAEVLAILHKPDASIEELSKLVQHVERVRKHAGDTMGERWLNAAVAAHGGSPQVQDLQLATYMEDGRTLRARRLMWGGAQHEKVPEYRLALAVEDLDYGEVKRMLAEPAALPPVARADAADLLERDDLEASALRDALGHDDPSEDHVTLARRLREIEVRHLPFVKLGGTYTYLNGLNAIGPDAAVAHDLGPLRAIYTARARSMDMADSSLILPHPRAEADVGMMLRATDKRGVTEVAAAFNYQPDRPLPRATFLDERLLGKFFSTHVEAATGDPIDDTPFLRLQGVRDRLKLGLRADVQRFYASVDLEGIEDHTRRFDNLTLGLEETAEAGVKIVRGEPEWDVGVQALAVQRNNVAQLPVDVVDILPYRRDPESYLPPSYQMLSLVTHFVRGDFAERILRDRSAFPRYDCEAGVGIIFPANEAAVHAQCSGSIRVVGTGYASVVGFYNLGVAGIANDQNAEAGLFYTQPL